MTAHTVHVHVERLVVDAAELGPGAAAKLAEALGDELSRRLADGPVPEASHVDRLAAPALPASAWTSAGALGHAAAASLAAAIRPGAEGPR